MMRLSDGRLFNDAAAFRACQELEYTLRDGHQHKQVAWTDVYSSEEELLADLTKVYIPKGRGPMGHCFQGYEFIYSFAYYTQKGWALSAKQMTQAKRLALEIKKAAITATYIKED